MAEPKNPALFTIPLDRAFADALVDGIIQRQGDNPVDLARGMIILANRRAVSAVRDAFIRQHGGAALFPRLVALGDGDLDEAAGAALDRMDAAALSPAIDPVLRQFRIASLIAQVRPDTMVGHAMRLAQSVAALIDQMQIENLDLSEFMALADGDQMAAHWERAFDLLRQILARWPDELARLGLVDRAHGRNMLWHKSAEQWREHGLPAPFVVAAGISTSAPAIARLLRVIALSPGGAVVLPHLDLGLDADQWQALGDDPRKIALLGEGIPPRDTHPQFHLKLLLDRMGFHRDEVAVWPSRRPKSDRLNRVPFVRQMMAPAEFTDVWPDLPDSATALPGVRFYDLADGGEEALTIALIMREALETPGKTAALVTSDRAIARRVMAQLSRWGITADDSAGAPLNATPAGEWLLSLINACASGLAPVALMSLLNHPFASGGGDRQIWLDRVRELDMILRGPRPAAGAQAVSLIISGRKGVSPDLPDWWEALTRHLSPLSALMSDTSGVALAKLLPAIREALDILSGGQAWAGADGRALAAFLTETEQSAAALDLPVTANEAAGLFRELMAERIVRAPQGGHPRLSIWGLIESRLQRADVMILAGLNEGQWPRIPETDPWLAPMVRRRLGLPGGERQIGLSAHDFGCALGAPEVVVTRARRVDGTPTVPSRFRLRIEALLGDARMQRARQGAHEGWARHIDYPSRVVRCARPVLAVPADRRPLHLSVTTIDTLKADPFAFYARAGLSLSRWDPLESELTPGWRGTIVHGIMEEWLRGGDWSDQAIDQLVDAVAARPDVNASLSYVWLPRVREAAHAFARHMRADREKGREPIVAATEMRGSIAYKGIELIGKPDRIDRLSNGTLAIVDYKTGPSPTKRTVEHGYAMQLGLLGLMAQDGAFTGQAELVSTFEYWRANRGKSGIGWVDTPFYKPSDTKPRRMKADNFIDEVADELDRLIADYVTGTAPFVAKLSPEFATSADYEQFMRLEEWLGSDDDVASVAGS